MQPKKLSPKQKRLSDRCKKRIPQLQAIPTDALLKQAANCRDQLGL